MLDPTICVWAGIWHRAESSKYGDRYHLNMIGTCSDHPQPRHAAIATRHECNATMSSPSQHTSQTMECFAIATVRASRLKQLPACRPTILYNINIYDIFGIQMYLRPRHHNARVFLAGDEWSGRVVEMDGRNTLYSIIINIDAALSGREYIYGNI